MAETAGFKPRLCELLPYRKATGSLKYFHDKYNSKTQFAEHQKYVDTFEEAMQYNEQIKPHVNKVLLRSGDSALSSMSMFIIQED